MWEITRVGEDVEKIETSYIEKLKLERPSEPLLGGSKERKKIKILERDRLSCVQCITIHSSWDMGTTYMSINRWMDKEDVLHAYSRILFSPEKEENSVICENRVEPGGCCAKWSKPS